MDDGVWLDSGEELLHSREIGNVTIMVRDGVARVTVRIGAQVENGDLGLGMALDDVADDVAAEEPTSTDNDHRAERLES